MNNNITDKAYHAYKTLFNAFETAKQDLIDIVRANGGVILTPPASDKPTLHCFVDYNGDCDYNTTESIPIQAIAYDEQEGMLMVLTNDELRNYEYDEDYNFEYLYDYAGEDKARYEDATKDITYFRELDNGYTAVNETIFSILAGLADYLA